MNILYACDNQYANLLLGSMYSLLTNHQNPIHIYLAYDQLDLKHQKRMDMLAQQFPNATLTFLNPRKIRMILDHYPIPTWRGSKIANARLFFREFMPDIDHLLYLDSDTIIWQNLEGIEKEAPISAVLERRVPPHYASYVSSDTKYFNSGVLSFHIQEWDKIDGTKKIADAVFKKHPDLLYPDQDLLNFALQNQIHPLFFSYNLFPHDFIHSYHQYQRIFPKFTEYYSEEEFEKAKNEAKILHMIEIGNVRPWIKNRCYPFNEVYEYYQKQVGNKIKKTTLNFPNNLFSYLSPTMLSYFNYSKTFIPTPILEKIKEKIYK